MHFGGRHEKRSVRRKMFLHHPTNLVQARKHRNIRWPLHVRPSGLRRRIIPLGALIAQLRYERGSTLYAYAKKRLLRKLGLRHKKLNEYLTIDFIRIGAAPNKEFNLEPA